MSQDIAPFSFGIAAFYALCIRWDLPMPLLICRSALIVATLCPALLLASCGAADDDPGVGGVTAGEARALNDAAAMLDRNAPPLVVPGGTPVPPQDNGAVRKK